MLYEFDENDNLICRCGEAMKIKFEFPQELGTDATPHYSGEDEWVCESCDFSLPCRRYSDWFGSGDTHEDVAEYLGRMEKEGELPLRIFYDRFMVCMVYPNEVVVFGYDGNEYTHSFHFTNEEPHIQPTLSLAFQLGLGKEVDSPND